MNLKAFNTFYIICIIVNITWVTRYFGMDLNGPKPGYHLDPKGGSYLEFSSLELLSNLVIGG